MPFDALGTLGSLPCEISLTKVLAARNDRKLISKITRLIFMARHKLQQLKFIPDKGTRESFRILHKRDTEQRLEEMMGVPVRGVPVTDMVVSHTMCCLNAYFKKARNES